MCGFVTLTALSQYFRNLEFYGHIDAVAKFHSKFA